MNIFVTILILLELCFFIPIANIKGKENRCSSYTCGCILKIQKQRKRKIIWVHEYYIPTIAYEVDGNHYEFQYNKSINADEYQVGDDFWVMYNPSNPTDVFQEDGFALIRAKFFAIIGIWIVFLTLVALV